MRTTITTRGLVLGVISLLATASLAVAQQPEASPADAAAGPSFNYQTGDIVLPNKVATLHLGANYRYRDPIGRCQDRRLFGKKKDASA